MEIVLLAITVVSLIVAVTLGVVAWRLARDERARSRARVAQLSDAANEPEPLARAVVKVDERPQTAAEPVAVGEARPAAPWPVGRVSVFAGSSRPTAEPQIAARGAGAAPVRPVSGDLSLRPASEPVAAPTAVSEGFLDPSRDSGGARTQKRLAVAAIFLFAIVLGGGYWTVYGSRSSGPSGIVATPERAPLELVSLRHERRGRRLSVTGLVRNPVAGAAAVEKLTAVVFLFDTQGAFITSAQANVDFLTLAPGDESPFVISLDAPANVARYRVSFRSSAGIVPHVDRRDQAPIAPANAVS